MPWSASVSGWVQRKCSEKSSRNWSAKARERLARLKSGSSTEQRERWRADPVAYAVEAAGIAPWGRQAEIMRAVAREPFVAVKSGHKTSKSNGAALLATWWPEVYPGGRVILTSASWTQVEEVLWREVRAVAQRLRDRGLVPVPSMPILPNVDWPGGGQILGLSTNQPERLQGLSGSHILVIIDEASGFPEEFFEALLGNTAGGGADATAMAKVLMLGNPTQTSGVFFDAFTDHADAWDGYTVSSTETPNCVEGRTVIPGLATREFVDGLAAKYGEDSDVYRVRVLGEFPRQGFSNVIAPELVDAALKRHTEGPGDDANRPLCIGLDVARFGDDATACVGRRGHYVLPDVRRVQGYDTMQVAALVLEFLRANRRQGEPIPTVNVDVTGGYGAGPADYLRAYRDEHNDPVCRVVDVNYSEKANDPDAHPNRRSELWFSLRDWLRDGGALPANREMRRDILAPKYAPDNRSRLVVESKESFKKRLKRSPDTGDALCLAVYQLPESPGIQAPVVAPSIGYRFGHARGFG